jgi:hypothetical protein
MGMGGWTGLAAENGSLKEWDAGVAREPAVLGGGCLRDGARDLQNTTNPTRIVSRVV